MKWLEDTELVAQAWDEIIQHVEPLAFAMKTDIE